MCLTRTSLSDYLHWNRAEIMSAKYQYNTLFKPCLSSEHSSFSRHDFPQREKWKHTNPGPSYCKARVLATEPPCRIMTTGWQLPWHCWMQLRLLKISFQILDMQTSSFDMVKIWIWHQSAKLLWDQLNPCTTLQCGTCQLPDLISKLWINPPALLQLTSCSL